MSVLKALGLRKKRTFLGLLGIQIYPHQQECVSTIIFIEAENND